MFQVWTRKWVRSGEPSPSEEEAFDQMMVDAFENNCEAMVVPVEDGDPNDWDDEEEEDDAEEAS